MSILTLKNPGFLVSTKGGGLRQDILENAV